MDSDAREPLLTGYHGRILLSITGGSLFISMVAMVIPPLLPTIIAELNISSTQAGLVMTVWWLAVALFNAPGGRVADQLSHKTGLIVGLVIAFVGIAFLAVSHLYVLLLLGVATVGIGRGVYQPSAIGQISDLFIERRGQALGLRGAAFNLGGVISGVLVAGVLAVAVWQATFLPILLGVAVVTASMHFWNREPYEIDTVRLNLRDTLSRLKGSRNIVLVIVALSLFGFAWNGSISFLPSFLQTAKGLSPTQASIAFSGVFAVGAIVQPLYGVVGDRRGHAIASFIAATLCASGLVGLLVFDHLLAVAVSLAVFAMGLASFWPVMMAFGLAKLSAGTRAGDWGAITAIFLSAEAVGSLYVGFVIDVANHVIAFASLLVFLLVTMLITFWLATFD